MYEILRVPQKNKNTIKIIDVWPNTGQDTRKEILMWEFSTIPIILFPSKQLDFNVIFNSKNIYSRPNNTLVSIPDIFDHQ